MNLLCRHCVVTALAIILSLVCPSQAPGANPPADSTAPEPIQLVVPATAGHRNPVKIATVSAGQKVTVMIGRVYWAGGGSKKGAFTNWQGFKDRLERNALPWMALVFAVGKQNFLPDKKEFTFTVPADGDLVAFANDTNPDGNSGRAEATVTIHPK